MFRHRPRLRGPTLPGERPLDTPEDRGPLALTFWDRARLWLASQSADETLDHAVAGALAAVCIAGALVLLVGWSGASGPAPVSQRAHATAPAPTRTHAATEAPAPGGGGGGGSSAGAVGGPVDLDPCDDPLDRVLRNTGRFAFKTWKPTNRCEAKPEPR